jgi:predicted ArsR family transcriptional regulator
MKTIRQRIIAHIQAKGSVSAAELSRALRMTPANARHHLAVLLDEGAIVSAGRRPAQGRGRPGSIYILAGQRREHNLDRLAGALLDALDGTTDSRQNESLARLAYRLAGVGPAAGETLTRRLNEAVKRLNEQHYAARWEAHAAAPHVILGHCPYAAILPEHPELCQMDGALLEALLAAPVTQIARLAMDSQGLPYCRFLVLKK